MRNIQILCNYGVKNIQSNTLMAKGKNKINLIIAQSVCLQGIFANDERCLSCWQESEWHKSECKLGRCDARCESLLTKLKKGVMRTQAQQE